MKKVLCLFLSAVLAAATVSACSRSEEFTPDYSSAIGIILVNGQQELPERTKVYADFSDHTYTFPLDAACVYYFAAEDDVFYAGDQNFTTMTFGADLDEDTVGAVGTVAYQLEEDSDNTVTAYYLYHDEQGVYFDTTAYFDSMEILDQTTFTGIDYASAVTFVLQEPTASFTITCYGSDGRVISRTEYAPDQVRDLQQFDMTGIQSAEVTSYSAQGETLSVQSVTPDSGSVTICFDHGGQILGNKILRFVWPE